MKLVAMELSKRADIRNKRKYWSRRICNSVISKAVRSGTTTLHGEFVLKKNWIQLFFNETVITQKMLFLGCVFGKKMVSKSLRQLTGQLVTNHQSTCCKLKQHRVFSRVILCFEAKKEKLWPPLLVWGRCCLLGSASLCPLAFHFLQEKPRSWSMI